MDILYFFTLYVIHDVTMLDDDDDKAVSELCWGESVN